MHIHRRPLSPRIITFTLYWVDSSAKVFDVRKIFMCMRNFRFLNCSANRQKLLEFFSPPYIIITPLVLCICILCEEWSTSSICVCVRRGKWVCSASAHIIRIPVRSQNDNIDMTAGQITWQCIALVQIRSQKCCRVKIRLPTRVAYIW